MISIKTRKILFNVSVLVGVLTLAFALVAARIEDWDQNAIQLESTFAAWEKLTGNKQQLTFNEWNLLRQHNPAILIIVDDRATKHVRENND